MTLFHLLALVPAVFAQTNPSGEGGCIHVTVDAIRNDRGQVVVAAFGDEVSYMQDRAPSAVVKVPARSSQVIASFCGLTPGRYALSVFHDDREPSPRSQREGSGGQGAPGDLRPVDEDRGQGQVVRGGVVHEVDHVGSILVPLRASPVAHEEARRADVIVEPPEERFLGALPLRRHAVQHDVRHAREHGVE